MRRSLALVLAAVALACAGGPPEPAELDTRHERCAHCRMAVSDPGFAGQVVAPGELPRFFDDVGCLGAWVRGQASLPEGAVAWVADHRTKAWVRAGEAVYTKVPGLETPMGSHVIAHADPASRDQDPDAGGGSAVAPSDLFGVSGPPGGGRRR